MAASLTKSGPSKLGKPCPRLIAPAFTAREVMSAKMVDPNGSKRSLNLLTLGATRAG